jgi:hypothetical protein
MSPVRPILRIALDQLAMGEISDFRMFEGQCEISAGKSRMLAYDHFNPCSLLVPQSLKNGAMLRARDCQEIGYLRHYDRAGSRERNQLNPFYSPTQHRAFGKIDERGVKSKVQVRIGDYRVAGGFRARCEEVRLRHPLDVVVYLPDPVQLARIGQPFGGQPCRSSFQHAARFNRIPDVANGEFPHCKTDAGFQRFEKALLSETFKREPDWRSRNAQALGYGYLEYAFAGLELTSQNHFP